MEREKSPTEKILERYHEIGHREVLRNWRETVPADVRKTWIRYYVAEVGTSKMSGDYKLFEDLIVKNLSPEDRQYYENLISRLETRPAQLEESERGQEEEDEGLEELEEDVRGFLLAVGINEKTLENFAEQYFLSFDTDKEALEKFYGQQQELASKLSAVLDALLTRGSASLSDLNREFPFETISALFKPDRDNYQGLEDYGGSLVVVGSSAIGPRKINSNYPRRQDVDFLFLPSLFQGEDAQKQKFILESVNYLHTFIEVFTKYTEQEQYSQRIGLVRQHFPELASFLDYVREKHIDLEIHTPLEEAGLTEDWTKLCGPHRVVKSFSQGAEAGYRAALNKAIASARRSSLE